jgi:hypothetical protein
MKAQNESPPPVTLLMPTLVQVEGREPGPTTPEPHTNVHPCLFLALAPALADNQQVVGLTQQRRQPRGMRTLKPRQFACPKCPSMFTHRNNLYYHCKFECGQLPRFSCPYCEYRARHSSNTRAHVRRKHPGLKVFTIDVCKVGQ